MVTSCNKVVRLLLQNVGYTNIIGAVEFVEISCIGDVRDLSEISETHGIIAADNKGTCPSLRMRDSLELPWNCVYPVRIF